MKKIAIVTDSNSGMTPAEAEELGVYLVPMPFFIDGELYYEGRKPQPYGFLLEDGRRRGYQHLAAHARRGSRPLGLGS